MEIKLPTTWEAVNLKQFAALQSKLQQEDTDAIERYIDIIALLSNEKPSLIMKMPIDALKKAIDYVSFINELPKETKIKKEYSDKSLEDPFLTALADVTPSLD